MDAVNSNNDVTKISNVKSTDKCAIINLKEILLSQLLLL